MQSLSFSLPRPLRVHGWTEVVNPWKYFLCISGPEGEISHTLYFLSRAVRCMWDSPLSVSRFLFVSHLLHELYILQQFMSFRVSLEAFPTIRVILRALEPGAGVWTQCSSLWLAWVLLDLDFFTRRQWAADGRRDKKKNILVKLHLFGTLCRKLAPNQQHRGFSSFVMQCKLVRKGLIATPTYVAISDKKTLLFFFFPWMW